MGDIDLALGREQL